MMNVLGLLDTVSEGDYFFREMAVSAASDRDRTRLRSSEIGFVFQAYHLLAHRTAVENVQLGLLYRDTPRENRRDLAIAALERVGLLSRATHTPSQLSGGEKQRVALARAIVGSPSLLLCDEPTGNLDFKNSQSILALLKDVNDTGITVIVVTHDRVVAEVASRHLYLFDGALSE